MNHLGTKVLESERLILRPFVPADAPKMFKNWASDPEVTRYLTWSPHRTMDVTEQVIAAWVAAYVKPNFYQWAIELKSLTEVIGSISVVKQNEQIAMMHVGYCIGKTWWNQGFVSEALREIIHFLFAAVEVNRIESRHDTRNPASGEVMKKCGMLYEGTLRQVERTLQGICDCNYYAVLRSDYVRDQRALIAGESAEAERGYLRTLRKVVGHRPLLSAGATVAVWHKDLILLQLRVDTKTWGLPGGALELGETLEQTARRELFEETGLKAGQLHMVHVFSGRDFFFTYPNGDQLYSVVTLFETDSVEGQLVTQDQESLDLAYFSLVSLPTLETRAATLIDWLKDNSMFAPA